MPSMAGPEVIVINQGSKNNKLVLKYEATLEKMKGKFSACFIGVSQRNGYSRNLFKLVWKGKNTDLR